MSHSEFMELLLEYREDTDGVPYEAGGSDLRGMSDHPRKAILSQGQESRCQPLNYLILSLLASVAGREYASVTERLLQ